MLFMDQRVSFMSYVYTFVVNGFIAATNRTYNTELLLFFRRTYSL